MWAYTEKGNHKFDISEPLNNDDVINVRNYTPWMHLHENSETIDMVYLDRTNKNPEYDTALKYVMHVEYLLRHNNPITK